MRRFSIPKGIKNMLKSLKVGGSSKHSKKVSVVEQNNVTTSTASSNISNCNNNVGGSSCEGQRASQGVTGAGGRLRRKDVDNNGIITPPRNGGESVYKGSSGSSSYNVNSVSQTHSTRPASVRDLFGGSTAAVPEHLQYRQIDVKPSISTTNSPAAVVIATTVCDKCDGKHATESCPYYKKPRESHPDAQKGSKRLGGVSTLPGATIRNGRVVRQPGDGSCLFHSLSYGLKDGSSAGTLRRQICAFIVDNPKLKIADTPLSDWVKWDSRSSVSQYARKMSGGAWGGGIEMATVSKMKGVNVHVYEQCGGVFKRISAFDHEDNAEGRPIIRVLYGGGVHYDALVA